MTPDNALARAVKYVAVVSLAATIYLLLVYFLVGHFATMPGLKWLQESFGRLAGARIWMHSVLGLALPFAAIPSAYLVAMTCRPRELIVAAIAGALVAGSAVIPTLLHDTLRSHLDTANIVYMIIDSIKFVAILTALTWLAAKLPSRFAMQFTAAVLAIALVGPVLAAEPAETRPESWAQPVAAEGAPNLHKVSDTLYRSAQPTAEGFRNLKELGIVTVVNLRSYHSDRGEIGATGLAYEHIYMKAWHPERKEAVRFLQIVTDSRRTPVLVHCQHGADRTGTMTAIYRIVVKGWSKEGAIREMYDGGFGFHRIWGNLPDWIRDLNVDSIRKEAGIGE